MKITLKLFATLSDYLPDEARKTNQMDLQVAEHTTIDEIVSRLNLPRHLVHLVLLNGIYVPPAARPRKTMQEGDALAIWPPIAGG